MKIIDELEQKYTIIKSKLHRLLLKNAWNRFKRTGNKEEFLEVLKRAEEAKLKHPSLS